MTYSAETLIKILTTNGTPAHGGSGKWNLPHNGRPGKWMPEIKNVELCHRGYHVVTIGQSLEWLHDTAYEVEVRGETKSDYGKAVWGQARLLRRIETWNDRTLRLFAADYAAAALVLVPHPGQRSVAAVTAARQFARGEIKREELAAARAAARAAAGDAAGVAAWVAAWDAARVAAWGAGAAAAAAAAEAAAEAAAKAAWAAWDAAWGAASGAAGAGQIKRWLAYLNGPEPEPVEIRPYKAGAA